MTAIDAPTQTWDPERYRRTAGFVATLGQPVLALLSPQTGERILDLGCGDGTLTKALADTGATVVGVDQSAEQIEAARALGLDAHVMDGADLAFASESFDAVFSNAAMHWMKDQDAVITGVARILKPGGRFVSEMGGHGNVAAIATALCAVVGRYGADASAVWPWVFPTPDEQRQRLERAGFRVESAELIPRPTPLPGSMIDWLETFAEPFLKGLAASDHASAKAETEALLAPSLRDSNGAWTADYVRLRFHAVKGT